MQVRPVEFQEGPAIRVAHVDARPDCSASIQAIVQYVTREVPPAGGIGLTDPDGGNVPDLHTPRRCCADVPDTTND